MHAFSIHESLVIAQHFQNSLQKASLKYKTLHSKEKEIIFWVIHLTTPYIFIYKHVTTTKVTQFFQFPSGSAIQCLSLYNLSIILIMHRPTAHIIVHFPQIKFFQSSLSFVAQLSKTFVVDYLKQLKVRLSYSKRQKWFYAWVSFLMELNNQLY